MRKQTSGDNNWCCGLRGKTLEMDPMSHKMLHSPNLCVLLVNMQQLQ